MERLRSSAMQARANRQLASQANNSLKLIVRRPITVALQIQSPLSERKEVLSQLLLTGIPTPLCRARVPGRPYELQGRYLLFIAATVQPSEGEILTVSLFIKRCSSQQTIPSTSQHTKTSRGAEL